MLNSLVGNNFGCKYTVHGATLFANEKRLSTAMKATEVDAHIARLCSELVALGAQMKAALLREDEQPLEFEE